MKITPKNDRVLLKRLESSNKTEGGIYLPDSALEKPLECTVVSVGEDVTEVSKNQNVLISTYTGHDVVVDGVDYVIVKEEEILCIVESESVKKSKKKSAGKKKKSAR